MEIKQVSMSRDGFVPQVSEKTELTLECIFDLTAGISLVPAEFKMINSYSSYCLCQTMTMVTEL